MTYRLRGQEGRLARAIVRARIPPNDRLAGMMLRAAVGVNLRNRRRKAMLMAMMCRALKQNCLQSQIRRSSEWTESYLDK